jgi:hypothetical protein
MDHTATILSSCFNGCGSVQTSRCCKPTHLMLFSKKAFAPCPPAGPHHSPATALLQAISAKLGISHPSLADVAAAAGCPITLAATSLARRAPVYLSSTTHPDMPVRDALRGGRHNAAGAGSGSGHHTAALHIAAQPMACDRTVPAAVRTQAAVHCSPS